MAFNIWKGKERKGRAGKGTFLANGNGNRTISVLQTNCLTQANESGYGHDSVISWITQGYCPSHPSGGAFYICLPIIPWLLQRNELISIKSNLSPRLSRCTMNLIWGLAYHLEIKCVSSVIFNQSHWNLTKVIEASLCQIRLFLIN